MSNSANQNEDSLSPRGPSARSGPSRGPAHGARPNRGIKTPFPQAEDGQRPAKTAKKTPKIPRRGPPAAQDRIPQGIPKTHSPQRRRQKPAQAAKSPSPAPPPNRGIAVPFSHEDEGYSPDNDSTNIADHLMQWVPGYKLIRMLGAGVSSEVYLAESLEVAGNPPVAVKILRTHLDENSDPLMIRSFEKEGKALGRIQHANVIRCHHSGLDRLDRPYLVMDYLASSQTLQEILAQCFEKRRGLKLRDIRSIILQILDGVAAAHALDIVHRDIKPGNIMLVGFGGSQISVKILDFGLAKFITEAEGTKTEHFAGTLTYAAPEQTMGQSLRPWTDVYAIAEILLEMLTGRSLFGHLSDFDVYRQKMEKGQTIRETLSTYLKGLNFPPAFIDFFAHALHRDPKKRIPTIDAFRQGLMPILALVESGCSAGRFGDGLPPFEGDSEEASAAPAQQAPADGVAAQKAGPAGANGAQARSNPPPSQGAQTFRPEKSAAPVTPTPQTATMPKASTQQDWLLPFVSGVVLSTLLFLAVVFFAGPQLIGSQDSEEAAAALEMDGDPDLEKSAAKIESSPQTPAPPPIWQPPHPFTRWNESPDAKDIGQIIKGNWESLPAFLAPEMTARIKPPLPGNWVLLPNGKGDFDVHHTALKRCFKGEVSAPFTQLTCTLALPPQGWPEGEWAVQFWTKTKALKP